MKLLLILLLILVSIVTSNKSKPRLWNFDFVRFEDCPNVGTNQINIKLKLNRISRDLLYLGGKVVNEVAMDSNISLHLKVDNWGNGGWRENAYIIKKNNACETIHEFHGKCFTNLLKAMGLPGEPPCPFPIGNFTVGNFDSKEFEYNTNLPPVMIIGRWRFGISFYDDYLNTIVGCFCFVCDVTTRQIKIL